MNDIIEQMGIPSKEQIDKLQSTTASGARTNLGLGTMATQNVGISATITTAKLTSLGSNGSMTFVNGILTAQSQAT